MPFKVVEPISIFFTDIINHPQCSKKEKKSSSRSAEIAAPLGAADRPCDVHPGCWHHCFTVPKKLGGSYRGYHQIIQKLRQFKSIQTYGFGDLGIPPF